MLLEQIKMKKYILTCLVMILLISGAYAGIALTSISVNPPEKTINNFDLRYNDKTNNKQKVINEQDGKIDDNDLWKLGKGDYTNVRNEKGERLIKETIIKCYDYHDKEQEGKLVEFCEERETGNYIFKKKAVVIKP